MNIAEIVGAGAAVCSTTSFVPQLLKLLRARDAEAVSLRMYVLTVGAFSLWSVYGLLEKSWPLVASNVISLGLSSAILVLSRWRQAEAPAPDHRPTPPPAR